MGGRRIELNPDEVIFATAQIYVDIVLLYQYILMFMGLMHHQWILRIDLYHISL